MFYYVDKKVLEKSKQETKTEFISNLFCEKSSYYTMYYTVVWKQKVTCFLHHFPSYFFSCLTWGLEVDKTVIHVGSHPLPRQQKAPSALRLCYPESGAI